MTVPVRRRVSRDDITAAAWSLFEEIGFEATSMTEIAQRAGISRRTLFNQVEHKVALLYPGIDDYVARFAHLLAERPREEPLFQSLAATFWQMASFADELAVRHDPGPEVLAARLRDAAVDYWTSEWATRMAAIILDLLGPTAEIQARFVGAMSAQIWSELARLQRENPDLDVNQAVAIVIGQLEPLVLGGAKAPRA